MHFFFLVHNILTTWRCAEYNIKARGGVCHGRYEHDHRKEHQQCSKKRR